MINKKYFTLLPIACAIAVASFAQQKNDTNKQIDSSKRVGRVGLFKHMKLPPMVLPDTDGDGITNQFDKEISTPRGCPVDSHGVSLDTDKDGIPDCRDKEPLTIRRCFPVDSTGVGLCPPPACCEQIKP